MQSAAVQRTWASASLADTSLLARSLVEAPRHLKAGGAGAPLGERATGACSLLCDSITCILCGSFQLLLAGLVWLRAARAFSQSTPRLYGSIPLVPASSRNHCGMLVEIFHRPSVLLALPALETHILITSTHPTCARCSSSSRSSIAPSPCQPACVRALRMRSGSPATS